jgi:hypothetical protein
MILPYSPPIVIFLGSPPNAAMFFCTHFNAATLVEQAIVYRMHDVVIPLLVQDVTKNQIHQDGNFTVTATIPLRDMLSPSYLGFRCIACRKASTIEINQYREFFAAVTDGVQIFRYKQSLRLCCQNEKSCRHK